MPKISRSLNRQSWLMMPTRRKKWAEEEERTLIDKYGEMLSNGTLGKMKTREKKFRPIATQVNLMHHARDPVAFPWQWSWKDASTKVQNMRHQYLLVKQKIKKPVAATGGDNSAGERLSEQEEFDWLEGLTYWSNFLRYRDVFGDIALAYNSNDLMPLSANLTNRENECAFDGRGRDMEISSFGHLGMSPEGAFEVGIDGGEDGVSGLGLGFEYNGEENNDNYNQMKDNGDDDFDYGRMDPIGCETKKKRKNLKRMERRACVCLANQLSKLREMEARFEVREAERERQRQRREQFFVKIERERERKLEEKEKEREERARAREMMRRERMQEWEAIEKECAERERQRKEEELILDREWEGRMDQKRSDWKKRIDDMLSHHQAAMDQIQSRILHEQQNLTSQLLGIVSQWTAHPTGLSDHNGASHPYLSQMIQNLHHVNEIVHGEDRVEGDNQDDQFIVDA